jgi:hypothetical protein
MTLILHHHTLALLHLLASTIQAFFGLFGVGNQIQSSLALLLSDQYIDIGFFYLVCQQLYFAFGITFFGISP